jgi:phage I-like protein
MQAMVDNQKVLKNTKPFLNEGHDRGKALGWANGLRVTDEGLEVKWGFTKLGRSLIEDDIYKYYSGEILHAIDSETGDKVYPVFGGAALTNSPVMKGMPEAHLSDGNITKAEGPKDEGEENMKFSELKEQAVNLSDSEKLELAGSIGFVNRDDEVTALSDKVTAMTDVNSNLTEQNKALGEKLKAIDAKEIEKFLDTKITEGKLKPADRPVWKERLEKDFADYSEIMNGMPKIVDTDGPTGTGQDNEDKGKDFKEMADDFSGKKAKKPEKEEKK